MQARLMNTDYFSVVTWLMEVNLIHSIYSGNHDYIGNRDNIIINELQLIQTGYPHNQIYWHIQDYTGNDKESSPLIL